MSVRREGITTFVYCDDCDLQYVFEDETSSEIREQLIDMGWAIDGDTHKCADCGGKK